MTHCKNCKEEIKGNFCSDCGHPVHLKRIDSQYIAHEINHVLHLEKGFFYTIKELLIAPGINVKTFLTNNRSRLVKPIIFLIVTSLAYTIISHFFHIEDRYVSVEQTGKTSKAISHWVQTHYGYSNIIMGIFIAFFLKLFFKKYDYNIFEILILLCFVMGMNMLFYSLFALFEGFSKISMMKVAAIIGTIYSSWAIAQFFDKTKAINYIKAIAAYLLGMLLFSIVTIIIGSIIDRLIQ